MSRARRLPTTPSYLAPGWGYSGKQGGVVVTASIYKVPESLTKDTEQRYEAVKCLHLRRRLKVRRN